MISKSHNGVLLNFIIGFWTGVVLLIGCNQIATPASAEGTTPTNPSTNSSGSEIYLSPTETICVSSTVSQGGGPSRPNYDVKNNRILAKLDKSATSNSCGVVGGSSSAPTSTGSLQTSGESNSATSDSNALKLFTVGDSPSLVWEVRLPSNFKGIATKALSLSYVVSAGTSTNNVKLTVMDTSKKTVTSSSGNAISLSTLSMSSSDLSFLTFAAGDIIHIFATCESVSGENCSIGGLVVGWI